MCLELFHGSSGVEEEEGEEEGGFSSASCSDDAGETEQQRDVNRLCRSLTKSLAGVGVTESLADQNTVY